MADPRFLKESGTEVFTGNELLLKGGLEGRMALLTGYPGSPVSEVFDAVHSNRDLLLQYGVVGQIANNEALAAARLNGTRMASLRAMAVMKSVGMHVASDGIAIGNLVEPNRPEGGAVIVVGDDPWNETTQINSDSRFLAQHLHIPILEPSTYQELKDWILCAFELSGLSNLYTAYLITTNHADGGGVVRARPNQCPTVNSKWKTEIASDSLPIRDYVMIPPHTSQKENTLAERYRRFLSAAEKMHLNQILHLSPQPYKLPLGIVTSGISYCYLEHALSEMGLRNTLPILKMGVTHPIDKKIVKEFSQKVKMIVVIEEKRPFLENQIKVLLNEMVQEGHLLMSPAVYGKKFPFDLDGFPQTRGLNASILIERLGALFLKLDLPELMSRKGRIQSEISLVEETMKFSVAVPFRTPTFCPGCPHRDSAVASLQLKKKHAGSKDILFHGESGCHSMLQFAPNEGLMQNYSGMGLGGGTGAGIDPFIKNKQVVFLGDSTFFHSGIVAVSDSIKNRQDITYVILDNKTTAMTGHQPTPGNDFDILGQKTVAQDIEKILRGMTSGTDIPVVRANPAYRESYSRLLETLVLKKGVKVVIADKECGITSQRRQRKEKKRVLREKGFLRREEFINITPDVCEYCLECTRSTGCPGLTVEETDFGPKIATDLSACVSDGACTKGKVCPSFEKVVIQRKNPPTAKNPLTVSPALPQPDLAGFEDAYYISTFAVGGMGAGVVSSVLVRAGQKQGYQVLFLDKKGLAIRNGGVYGHIIFSKDKNRTMSPVVPYGKADLILGIDILETARGMDPQLNMRVASPGRTAAIINSHKTETVLSLMGKNQFDPRLLEDAIKQKLKKNGFFSIDFSEISQKFLGSKIYVNLLLIGAAFQKGLLPVSAENLRKAITESVPTDELEENLRAFDLGRELALNPLGFQKAVQKERVSYRQTIEFKSEILSQKKFGGIKLSQKYRQITENAVRWMHLDEPSNQKIAQRIYELIQYEGVELAEKYISLLWEVYRKDKPSFNFSATRAVIDNLFKVLAIKDEVYVAHLLTSSEKLERDKARYNVDESRGDKISYIHFNRPQFRFFGIELEFDLNSRNWMLRIMKHCKFLRRILPEWHHAEKEFRDWYIELVKGFNYFEGSRPYLAYVEILKAPEQVNGYREIRAPKMEAARKIAELLRAEISAAENAPMADPPLPKNLKDEN